MVCGLCRYDISVVSRVPHPSQTSISNSQIPPTSDRPETRASHPLFHKRTLDLCTSSELSTFAFLDPGDGPRPSVCPAVGRDFNAVACSAFSHVDISWIEAKRCGDPKTVQRAPGYCVLVPLVEPDDALHILPHSSAKERAILEGKRQSYRANPTSMCRLWTMLSTTR